MLWKSMGINVQSQMSRNRK